MPQKLEFSVDPETKEVKQETKIKEDGKVVGRSLVDAMYDIKNAVYKASTKVFNECNEEVKKYREKHGVDSVDTGKRGEIVRGVVQPQVEELFDGAETVYAMGGETMRSVGCCLGCRTTSEKCVIGAVVSFAASATTLLLGYTAWGWGFAAASLMFVAAKKMCE